MLKKRELTDCAALFELMTDPAVFPYVRQKAGSIEEFMFLTKQTLEAEEHGELISRTIQDEWGNAIGTINLFDVRDGAGFLGTWIGKPYFGKGYNQMAKDAFFTELFFEQSIETIFMRINKENIRSQKAAEKLPYVLLANDTHPELYNQINSGEKQYHLYKIEKDHYLLHTMRQPAVLETAESELKEA